MNKININEENNFNPSKNENASHINKLEINLLDTVNDKDLFRNIINNNDNINCLTENYQLDINEIIDKNSDNNSNKENNEISNNSENEKIYFDEMNKKINNNSNIDNYDDFNSFMKTKMKKKNNKIPKSFSSNKIKYKKISTPVMIKNYKTNNKSKEINNKVECEKKKVKYSKERIELNKLRINKLYSDYKKILDKIENKKKELSEEEIKNCSFSPKINKYSKKIIQNNSKFSKPIYLRYNNDLSRKKILFKKYQLNFTHIPKINKNYHLYLTHNENSHKNDNQKIIKNNKSKESDNIIKNVNIIKRKLLLDEYISNQKIMNFNDEDISSLNLKTNHCKINLNKNLKYPIVKNLNLEKYFYNNISRNKRNKKDKKLLKSKSFYFDYIKGINKKINRNAILKQKITPIISINEMDKYFVYNYNNKENVIKNFIDKLNTQINTFNKDNKGICYNITEQCMNIKKIILKNKLRSRTYK